MAREAPSLRFPRTPRRGGGGAGTISGSDAAVDETGEQLCGRFDASIDARIGAATATKGASRELPGRAGRDARAGAKRGAPGQRVPAVARSASRDTLNPRATYLRTGGGGGLGRLLGQGGGGGAGQGVVSSRGDGART